MNKRGSILDGIYITIIILALFLGFTMARVVWEGVSEAEGFTGNVTEAKANVERYNSQFIPMFDKFFVFVIIGSYISVFILAFFIRGTPAFLPIMIMIIIIGVVLSTFVSNAHNEILKDQFIADTVADWTMTAYLMENLPIISFFMLVALTVVMLALGETL